PGGQQLIPFPAGCPAPVFPAALTRAVRSKPAQIAGFAAPVFSANQVSSREIRAPCHASFLPVFHTECPCTAQSYSISTVLSPCKMQKSDTVFALRYRTQPIEVFAEPLRVTNTGHGCVIDQVIRQLPFAKQHLECLHRKHPAVVEGQVVF